MVTTPTLPDLRLSPEQVMRLYLHAAARNCSPEQALDELLHTDPPQRRPWTEEELELLRNPKNSPRSLARRTGRTATAVSVRRNKLAHDENLPELMRNRTSKGSDKPADPGPKS